VTVHVVVAGVSADAGGAGVGLCTGGVVCDGAGVTVVLVLVLVVVTDVESTAVVSGFLSVLTAHAVAV
jgi:hypothetical protein